MEVRYIELQFNFLQFRLYLMTPEHYSVYVVKLKEEALKRKKLLKLNPNRDPAKPILYVGSTGLPPEVRFAKHKAGLKANMFVKNYGEKLLPELTKDYNNMPFQQAEDEETNLANKLRLEGYTVLGGTQAREKKAYIDEELPLKEHQKRVVRKMQDPTLSGLVVAHNVGTGKSLSGIAAAKALGMPTNVIVPAALQENYNKEFRKWLGRVPRNVNVVSQQRLANSNLDTKMLPNSLDIIDESQAARNPDSNLLNALTRSKAKKRMLLSGTPLVNGPHNLGTLVNLAANKPLLPTDKTEFAKQYIQENQVEPSFFGKLMGVAPGIDYELKNRRKLKKILDRYVDYQPSITEGYPTVNYSDVKVPMGDHQMNLYKTMLGAAPWHVRYRIRHNLPPQKGGLDSMKAFLTGPRQASNSNYGFTTKSDELEAPKIDAAFNFFKDQLAKDPNYKAVVYNNFIQGGIDPYKKRLEEAKIPYGEFSGRVSPREREQAVRDYNLGKLKALLITQAGSEGIDLKKTFLTQVLTPHFQNARIQQVIGRGARYKSHEGLPPDKQKMLVQRYFATPQRTFMDKLMGRKDIKGVDEYIYNLANQKDKINREIIDLMNPEQKQQWYQNF
ncbi:hypothetical protein CCP3SC5AM1_2130002 [Gammaproteobacteria bacterium]